MKDAGIYPYIISIDNRWLIDEDSAGDIDDR